MQDPHLPMFFFQAYCEKCRSVLNTLPTCRNSCTIKAAVRLYRYMEQRDIADI